MLTETLLVTLDFQFLRITFGLGVGWANSMVAPGTLATPLMTTPSNTKSIIRMVIAPSWSYSRRI